MGAAQVSAGVYRVTATGRNRLLGLGVAGYAIIAYVALHALFALFARNYFEQGGAIVSLLNVGTPLLAAALCLLPGQRAGDRRERLSWWCIGLGLAASALAEGIWAYNTIVFAEEPPAVSVADLAYALYYPLTFAGVLLQYRRSDDVFARLTVLLDIVLFAVAAAGGMWHFLAEPFLVQAENELALYVNLSYPIGDVFLLTAVVSLILHVRLPRLPTHVPWLILSFLVVVFADVVYLRMLMEDSYAVGSPLDELWMVSYAATGMAAVYRWRSLTAHEEEGINLGWAAPVRLLLPYAAMLAAFALMVHWNCDEHFDETTADEMAIVIAVTVLIVVRQFVILLQNRRLTASLASLSQGLERMVAERTKELRHLNESATRLSRCLSSAEVLQVGLDAICKATEATVGAVWLRERDGTVRLAAQQGVTCDSEGPLTQLASVQVLADPDALSTGPALVRLAETAGVGAELASLGRLPAEIVLAPLLSRRAVLGVVGVGRPGSRSWEAAELQLVHSIGAQWGVALENARRYEYVAYLADHDSVTELYNHRALFREIERELERARRKNGRLALLMMDLDNFKLFNDTYGHLVGDQVLRQVATVLTQQKRAYDLVGRYGGDEFAALLPDTDLAGALAFARRVREAMRGQPYLNPEGAKLPIRISFGVATYPDSAGTAVDLVARADANLLESKLRGGDAICYDSADGEHSAPALGSFSVLDGLVMAVDRRDRYTRQHSEDVTRVATAIAHQMGLSSETERTLRTAGLLHDVGKIGVPDQILRKPGRLDEEEYAVVKQHVQLGVMIIKEVPNLNDVLAAVESHHERYDGKGYPRGLKGEEIPLLGRILAVADCYSAMTTDRPYRKALTPLEAKAELRRVAGTQLDPAVVEAFIAAMNEAEEVEALAV